ncbi:type IV secretory system conjugative DNA transfer family protein [Gluconacetobacter sp. 1b LMG 1731]|uniref:Type IV secretory system conjugative DNA transfer family protein n=1 Tax=Gluconacetobacter dulcium TaxID=2729096 RepID=A0A7W4IKD3_9PROT|nr:type IV secretory system conjugative DNA transfer family protein [Gluconacetobacter dulcium]MBB2164498.1 type IV secretory system conjugative DNA transfer family protein [Gluconacetobacter dulcium]MBB2193735.1 type IV secretory system conjugative DNA transfer family protein [Gluconacetobacter dulcium]
MREALRPAVGLFIASLCAYPAHASAQSDGPVESPVPQIPATVPAAANAIDTPIAGASEAPDIPDVDRPPSLEALMAIRPGYSPKKEEGHDRDEAVRQAAWAAGAQGGRAAESFAINEMLRRYAPILDRKIDFRTLVLPAGNGQTLLRPPVVTEAQMALALDPTGQTARETATVYQITREARLVSAVPQWRTWLVRTVGAVAPPPDVLRPRTPHEVEIWKTGLAYGWASGERQAVDIFLADLGRLERDVMGMARYRLLLRAGKVAPPEISYRHVDVEGGHDIMRLSNDDVKIRMQPGLDANRAHWRVTEDAQ